MIDIILMQELRLKFAGSNNREVHIQILTLAPTSWSSSIPPYLPSK